MNCIEFKQTEQEEQKMSGQDDESDNQELPKDRHSRMAALSDYLTSAILK